MVKKSIKPINCPEKEDPNLFLLIIEIRMQNGSRILLRASEIRPYQDYLIYNSNIVDDAVTNEIQIDDIDYVVFRKKKLTTIEADYVDVIRVSENTLEKYFLDRQLTKFEVMIALTEIYGYAYDISLIINEKEVEYQYIYPDTEEEEDHVE